MGSALAAFVVFIQSAILIWIALRIAKKNPFSFFLFAVVYHFVFLILGFAITINADLLVRDKLASANIMVFAFQTSLFTGCLVFFHFIRKLTGGHCFNVRPFIETSRANKILLYGMLLISAISIFMYGAATGFGDSMGGYEERYDQTRGLGALYLLMPLFVPYFFWALIRDGGKGGWHFWINAAGFIFFGAAVFVFTVGLRFYLLSSILCVLLILYFYGKIKAAQLVFIFCAFPFLVGALSMIRYGYSESNSSFSAASQLLLFLQGDIFPVDALYNIHDYCIGGGHTCPGLVLAENQFLRVIPRAIWTDKPDIMLSSSAYYTEYIMNSSRELTLSPTIMGEAILISASLGGVGVVIYNLFSISILVWIDRWVTRSPTFAILIAGYFSKVFGWHRGGITLFLYWLVTVGVVFSLFFVASRIIDATQPRVRSLVGGRVFP